MDECIVRAKVDLHSQYQPASGEPGGESGSGLIRGIRDRIAQKTTRIARVSILSVVQNLSTATEGSRLKRYI